MKPNITRLMFGSIFIGRMSQYNRVAYVAALFAVYDDGAEDLIQNEAVKMGIVFG